jgi:hypothetical protein
LESACGIGEAEEVGNILVKGISPKFRILLAGTMALSFSFSRDLRTVLLLTGYGALLALCGELPLRNVVRNLLRIEGVFLCLWCTLPFTSGGASFSLGGVSLSVEGVRLALLISLKGAGMMLALAGLFGGIPVHMLFLRNSSGSFIFASAIFICFRRSGEGFSMPQLCVVFAPRFCRVLWQRLLFSGQIF